MKSSARGGAQRVRERHPAGEEQRRQCDKPRDNALVPLLHRRGEEAPRLPDEHREGERERGVEADLQRRRERLGHTERDELAVVRRRSDQRLDQLLVEDVGDQATPSARMQTGRRGWSSSRCSTGTAPRRTRGGAGVGASDLGNGVALAWRCGRATRSSSSGASGSRGGRSSSRPVTASLNSRMPLPTDLPISGTRLAPKRRTTTRR